MWALIHVLPHRVMPKLRAIVQSIMQRNREGRIIKQGMWTRCHRLIPYLMPVLSSISILTWPLLCPCLWLRALSYSKHPPCQWLVSRTNSWSLSTTTWGQSLPSRRLEARSLPGAWTRMESCHWGRKSWWRLRTKRTVSAFLLGSRAWILRHLSPFLLVDITLLALVRRAICLYVALTCTGS